MLAKRNSRPFNVLMLIVILVFLVIFVIYMCVCVYDCILLLLCFCMCMSHIVCYQFFMIRAFDSYIFNRFVGKIV